MRYAKKLKPVEDGTQLSVQLVNDIINRIEQSAEMIAQYYVKSGTDITIAQTSLGRKISYAGGTSIYTLQISSVTRQKIYATTEYDVRLTIVWSISPTTANSEYSVNTLLNGTTIDTQALTTFGKSVITLFSSNGQNPYNANTIKAQLLSTKLLTEASSATAAVTENISIDGGIDPDTDEITITATLTENLTGSYIKVYVDGLYVGNATKTVGAGGGTLTYTDPSIRPGDEAYAEVWWGEQLITTSPIIELGYSKFTINWGTPSGTFCGTAAQFFTISNRGHRVSANFANSFDCGGSCSIRQFGSIAAFVTIGEQDLNLSVSLSGTVEYEQKEYDVAAFGISTLGTVVRGRGIDAGAGCFMGGADIITVIPGPYLLEAGQGYTLQFSADTVDGRFHLGAGYNLSLNFTNA
jgi:hypothetical protein